MATSERSDVDECMDLVCWRATSDAFPVLPYFLLKLVEAADICFTPSLSVQQCLEEGVHPAGEDADAGWSSWMRPKEGGEDWLLIETKGVGSREGIDEMLRSFGNCTAMIIFEPALQLWSIE